MLVLNSLASKGKLILNGVVVLMVMVVVFGGAGGAGDANYDSCGRDDIC